MRAARTLLIGLGTSLGVGVGSGLYAFDCARREVAAIEQELPEVAEPGTYRPSSKTRILAADGTLLLELYRENREFVPLPEIPEHLVNATIAAEDRRFREHVGVSPRDIGRAALINVVRGRVAQGASTITQQLARDLYLTRRRQVRRKIGEAVLAVQIERRYSKDEILELYLNEINYGRALYGVRTAAMSYFGKLPRELTLAECAALAQIPQRPSANNLYDDPAGAVRRRNLILQAMVEQGSLTDRQRDAARREPLRVRPYQPADWTPRAAPYYTTWAVRELIDLLGEDRVYAGGLTVVTQLDLKLQTAAEDAVRAAVQRAAGRGATEGAAVLLDVRTGAVLAIVGGRRWAKSQFNRATQAKRQPGSAFKVFVYTAAIDRGYRPTDTIVDEPLVLDDGPDRKWRPTNYDHRWHGQVTLRQALAQSINIPAIKLLQKVGVQSVISYARRMGIRSALRPFPSLALGTSEVTLLELVSAYATLPNDGRRVEPTTIRTVTDATGKLLYRSLPDSTPVLTPQTAYVVTTMLREVMATGTGKPAAMPIPCAGKTGTTQNGRDAWFVGFTPEFAAGVWLGDDDNGHMRNVFGGTDCGPAWRRIVQAAVKQRGGGGQFPTPNWMGSTDPRGAAALGLQIEITGGREPRELLICPDSGLLARPDCPEPEKRRFAAGTEPKSRCPLHLPPTLPERVLTPEAPERPEPEPAADVTVDRPEPVPYQPSEPEPDAAPPKRSPQPRPSVPLIRQYVICADSGLLAKPTCPNRSVRDLDPAEAPTRECNLH